MNTFNLATHGVSVKIPDLKQLFSNFHILSVFLLVQLSLTGCQMLFHDQDVPAKGQKIMVSMTVPQAPPQATPPLKQDEEKSTSINRTEQKPIDKRLLPLEKTSVDSSVSITNPAHSWQQRKILSARPLILAATTVIDDKTVAEDMTLRGHVLIRGSLVIAPQATLRVESGTIIRFTYSPGSTELPRLVVQGRIVASGKTGKPITITSAFRDSEAGDWGGVVLLSSEKKNRFEHCHIEGAQTALAAHFSSFSGQGLTVANSLAGIALYDSEAFLRTSKISRCNTGLRLSDSELDVRESTINENRQGILALHSSFTLSSVQIISNAQEGIIAEQCRFRFTDSLFSQNRIGGSFTGGHGQLLICKFHQNRENGAEFSGVRIRITSSSFQTNAGVGVLLKNARGSITSSTFNDNYRGNLHYTGTETFAALLNWWGSKDERLVSNGISGGKLHDESSSVLYYPFLKTPPVIVP